MVKVSSINSELEGNCSLLHLVIKQCCLPTKTDRLILKMYSNLQINHARFRERAKKNPCNSFFNQYQFGCMFCRHWVESKTKKLNNIKIKIVLAHCYLSFSDCGPLPSLFASCDPLSLSVSISQSHAVAPHLCNFHLEISWHLGVIWLLVQKYYFSLLNNRPTE